MSEDFVKRFKLKNSTNSHDSSDVSESITGKGNLQTSTPTHTNIINNPVTADITSPNLDDTELNVGLKRVGNDKPCSLPTSFSTSNIVNDANSNTFLRKVFDNFNEKKEAHAKALENYVNNLKSIDLNKFSFPNENKPKTGYTYAETITYLPSSISTEKCDMPNMCRRSRRSPNSSNVESSNKSISSIAQLSTSFANQSSFNSQSLSSSVAIKKENIGFFESVKSVLFISNTVKSPVSNSTIAITRPTSLTATSSNQPLYRNIVYDLDENERLLINSSYGLENSDQTPTEIKAYQAQIQSILNTRASKLTSDSIDINQSSSIRKITPTRKPCITLPCVLYFSLFILLLTPFIIFGTEKYLSNEEILFDEELVSEFQTYCDEEIYRPAIIYMKQSIFYLDYLYETCKLNLIDSWSTYWPSLVLFLNNSVNSVKEWSIQNMKPSQIAANNEIDYQPSINNQYNINFIQNEEILKDLSNLKEKLLNDALGMKNYKEDIDSMREELDRKFNFTFNMFSNRLMDQLMQIEATKVNHDHEIRHLKDVLKEVENRYTNSMTRLEEQISKQINILEEKTQLKENKKIEVNSELKSALSNEFVTFEKIEEYINKTFYLYNADKTGMTDFASESVGGSILFTKCTDNYIENSRWFTVFNVPITRVVTTPRVVIQGSIQPGNCWAFKGSKGDLFIKLAAKISPTSFSLEHIPKELSLTGKIDSAPENFTVYGYERTDEISDDTRYLLGNYRYDNNSKSTLQFFNVQYLNKPISVIELKIESNAGNKDYTCLYKFRVHGKLFDQIHNEPYHEGFHNEN